MSFAKTVRQLRDGSKTVTRRDGWRFLKPGDVVEGIEWSARVGLRWVCERCKWNGGSRPDFCPGCGESDLFSHRHPGRLGCVRVVSVRREPLRRITPDEVRREGFPGRTPAWFIAMYCAPRAPEPDRVVTRIEFEPMDPLGILDCPDCREAAGVVTT